MSYKKKLIEERIKVWLTFPILIFIGLTLFGCSASEKQNVASTEPPTELITKYEVPTPEDQMAIAKNQIADEMRVFDVGEHHETLYAMILESSKGLTEEEARASVTNIVSEYMDDYFLDRIGEVLSMYNEDYAYSDVETIFNSTSRASLYELIELYEWTFYQNNH